MWILGAALGLAIGGLLGNGAGAFAGALLGGVAGAVFSELRKKSPADAEARLAHLESRLTALGGTLEKLIARLAALEARLAGTHPQAGEGANAQTLGSGLPAAPTPIATASTAASAAVKAASAPANPAAPTTEPIPAAAATRTPLPLAPEPQTLSRAEPPPPPFWWKWFFGGNTLVRAGIAILFVGVAFLVKYAAEHAHFPIELRLAMIALGAIVMLVVGWRLREKRPGYGLSMQGGGVAVLYLTVFAALRLYAMLPPTLAFALMVGVVAASALLALRQDALPLAVIATAGGFLAPILTSTGHGSHVMLFSYYLLLNLGIFAIAWSKTWRALNLLGFAFTFVISALWGWKNYTPENFATTEPFLIIFFLLYAGIALLYALRRSLEVTHYVDGTLVFGTPIVAFGLQSQLMKDTEYGLAFSSLALAAFYIVLAATLWKRRAQGMLLLVESFLALGVVFATLTLPLALDGRWTSAAWALEGAAVVWIGGRQNRRLAQWFGIALQFAAGIAFLHSSFNSLFASGSDAAAAYPIVNSNYLGCVFVALAGLFCGFRVHRHGEMLGRMAAPVSAILFLWGLLWWVAAGLREVDLFTASQYVANAQLMVLTASALVFALLYPRLQWPMVLLPQGLLLPAMIVFALALLVAALFKTSHPFANLGWIAWPASFAVLLWILRRREDLFPKFVVNFHHAGWLWLATALACWETAYWIDDEVAGAGTWPFVAWAMVPGLVLGLLSRFSERITWPLAKHLPLYLQAAASLIAIYLFCWIFVANIGSDGDPAPLPFVPLLNPLDIAMLLVLLALAAWYLKLRALNLAASLQPQLAGALLGSAAFAWLNGSLLRTLHHWAGIPYQHTAMFESMLVQTSLTVFWTVLACGLMLFATRRALRTLWMVGGALLVVVVAKLFLIDLSHISGIERIVSFIGVGIMLLAIGYFSPVPPHRTGQTT